MLHRNEQDIGKSKRNRNHSSGAVRGILLLSCFIIFFCIVAGFNAQVVHAAVCDCTLCHGVSHHGTTSWQGCQTSCHLSPPSTGAHSVHSAATISNSTYGDTVTSTADQYRFGCGHCHSMDVTKHRNGTKDVELRKPTDPSIGQSGQQVCSECHGSGPHGSGCNSDLSDCLSCHSNTQGSSPVYAAINQGVNHHTGACTDCHYVGAPGGLAPHDGAAPNTANATCAVCHTSGSNATHHISTATACTSCHTIPGVTMLDPTDANCKACHGAKPSADMTSVTCIACHGAEPISKATAFAACKTCHIGIQDQQAILYGTDIHSGKPKPNFIAPCDTTISNKINFDASTSTCPSGNCTYTWSTGETGITASHTFGAAGSYEVSLTVKDNVSFASVSTTKTVTTCTVNNAPVCNQSAASSAGGREVHFADTSTDDYVGGAATVTVDWGDTNATTYTRSSNGDAIAPSHTYALNGNYTIRHGVQDAKGQITQCSSFVVTVPLSYKVTVNTSAAIASALVQVKQGTLLKAQGYTNASGTWTSLALIPGSYTMTISKAGVTFDCDPGASGSQNTNLPADLTSGNVTFTCTHTP